MKKALIPTVTSVKEIKLQLGGLLNFNDSLIPTGCLKSRTNNEKIIIKGKSSLIFFLKFLISIFPILKMSVRYTHQIINQFRRITKYPESEAYS